MVLTPALRERLDRVILEHRQRETLLMYNLSAIRKLLLVGPPGTGKTMTVQALAGELKLPLMTVLLEGTISKFMGETASKLKLIFDAMETIPGIYFFDEFDAIGAKRNMGNDVGEIRRVLNSFLQLLENDRSDSLIIAATNHPELLDMALYRRFDDVIQYALPDRDGIEAILKNNLSAFDTKKVRWGVVLDALEGQSQAEVARLAADAAKSVVLAGRLSITNKDLLSALEDRSNALVKSTTV
jgi:SpoVK/Ycf46/Vps4 family AAA+-type ATPase